MGFSCSYDEVEGIGKFLSHRQWLSEIEIESLSQAHLLRMHTRVELWIMEIFIDRSSISGTESGHITMQVLYQEITSTHESKPRASEMNLSKSTARLL